eukprot:UN24847
METMKVSNSSLNNMYIPENKRGIRTVSPLPVRNGTKETVSVETYNLNDNYIMLDQGRIRSVPLNNINNISRKRKRPQLVLPQNLVTPQQDIRKRQPTPYRQFEQQHNNSTV